MHKYTVWPPCACICAPRMHPCQLDLCIAKTSTPSPLTYFQLQILRHPLATCNCWNAKPDMCLHTGRLWTSGHPPGTSKLIASNMVSQLLAFSAASLVWLAISLAANAAVARAASNTCPATVAHCDLDQNSCKAIQNFFLFFISLPIWKRKLVACSSSALMRAKLLLYRSATTRACTARALVLDGNTAGQAIA